MSSPSNQNDRVDALVRLNNKAIAALGAGEYDEAIRCLEKIAVDSPDFDHGAVLLYLGDAFQGKGEVARARRYYEKAIKRQPDNSLWVGKLASFLFLYGQPAEAFFAFAGLLRLDVRDRNLEMAAESIKTLEHLGDKIGWNRKETWHKVLSVAPIDSDDGRVFLTTAAGRAGWSEDDVKTYFLI